MKLSTRGRYGIHAMYDLAVHYGDGPQSIKSIAERQTIPEAYLEQLIALLRREGLVISNRGAQGGYMLSRPPGEITVGDILRSLEGGLTLLDCLEGEYDCPLRKQCRTQQVWSGLEDAMASYLGGISLRDLPAMEQTHS